jgi:hypothetical protein
MRLDLMSPCAAVFTKVHLLYEPGHVITRAGNLTEENSCVNI